jgi:amino acid transporter
MGLLLLAAVPFVYSVPMSLAAAELNSVLPVQGGFYRWVRAGSGDFWGFQAGWWNWTGTFLMNSAYGVLFVDYAGPYAARIAGRSVAAAGGGWLPADAEVWKWLGAAAFLWVIAYANIRGIEVAGWIAVALQLVILIPVAWFCVAALFAWKQSPVAPLVPPETSAGAAIGAGLPLVIWLYSGYEQISSVAEEMKDSRRAFRVALAWMTPLAILTYVAPMLLGLAALGNWQEWRTGFLTTAARAAGGEALGAAMLAASVVGVASLSNSTVLSASRVPFAMAEDGYLPRWLARLHGRYRTPAGVIVAATLLCCALAVYNVVELIAVYIWMRIASGILTLLAAWQLRRKMPDAPRSFRIGAGTAGLIYAVAAPILFSLAALWFVYWEKPETARLAAWLLGSGPAAYLLCRWTLRRGAASAAQRAGAA